MILIKDNHHHLFKDVKEAIKKAKGRSFTRKVEIEVTSLNDVIESAEAGADIIMLDNFKPIFIGHWASSSTWALPKVMITTPKATAKEIKSSLCNTCR